MKFAAVIIAYYTPRGELNRLKKELHRFGIEKNMCHVVDNTRHNRGYGTAANIGIKKVLHAQGVIIINPDIHVTEGSVADLARLHKTHALCGGVMTYMNRSYYGGLIDKKNLSGSLNPLKSQKVDFVSGSFLSIRTDLIHTIGYFNEDYFMYYEDVEYAMRAKKHGYTSAVTEAVKYVHFQESPHPLSNKDYYLTRNRLKTLWKYGSPSQKFHEFYASIKNTRYLFDEKKHYKLHAFFDSL